MNQVRVGLAVVIIKDNKFIMIKRKGSHAAGTYAFPGGHLELDENFETCARREVMEELGIEITNLRKGPFFQSSFDDGAKQYVTLYMFADYPEWETKEPQIMEPEKCSKIFWCNFATLPYPLFPSILELKSEAYGRYDLDLKLFFNY